MDRPVASVPVYVLLDTILGTGAVGGSVASVEAFGKRAGELARLVLTGTPPGSLPFEIRTDGVPMFDWRALKRWGISESLLPPDSEIRFRPQSIWEHYRWYIIGTLIIILVQTAMIVALVLQHRHRRRIQAVLHRQRSFLRQVIDVNPNFIFAKDREGRFTLANQAVADAYGVTVDDLIGKRDTDLNPNVKEVEFFRRIDLEVLNTLQERFIPEERITDAQGNVRWLQTVKRPLIGSDGSANQLLGASTDITEHKKAEMELREQRAELAHVARVSLMGELAASLAHELNQPLTAILSNAKAGLRFMAAAPVNLEELREILGDIVEANSRASEVIRRMRTLVKKEQQLEFGTLDLGSLILDVTALVHTDAVMQNVHISLELDGDLPPVQGDRVQLQQVVLNILLNAFDANKECPPGERDIKLRAQCQDDGMLRVSVSDCGRGLKGGEFDQIFEPFYTTKREGLGMGLSICRSIIQAHGGTLWAQNNPERGATFYFTVPVERT